MKVGVLGDIHGNSLALAAVLERARREHVERLLITGDLVGYYFSPAEVMHMLSEWETVIVRGNHEDMLAAVGTDPSLATSIGKNYGSALAIALAELSGTELDMLCKLPHPASLNLGDLRVLLCHGAPWDNNFYVYPDADSTTLAHCAVPGYDIVIMGHTHHPLLRTVSGVTLLNPGSVGQPRNRQPGAQWAVLDTVTHEVSLRSERYDWARVAEEAHARHPELPYLADVLTRT